MNLADEPFRLSIEWPRMEPDLEESELYWLRYWWNKRDEAIDYNSFTKYLKDQINQKLIEKIDHVGAWKVMAWDMPDMVKIIPNGERIIKFLFDLLNDGQKHDGRGNRIM